MESDDPVILPCKEQHKAALVAELPTAMSSDGLPIHLARKVHQLPDGLRSLGARALHVMVKVNSLGNIEVKGCLDSGTDIERTRHQISQF